jgi:hypothetical protein
MLSALVQVNGPPFPTGTHVVAEEVGDGVITAKDVVDPV